MIGSNIRAKQIHHGAFKTVLFTRQTHGRGSRGLFSMSTYKIRNITQKIHFNIFADNVFIFISIQKSYRSVTRVHIVIDLFF